MRKTDKADSVLSPIAGRWQVPMFLLGLSVFAAGMGKMAVEHQPRTFAEELSMARKLREGGALPRASAFLMHLLNEKNREPLQRATLHLELAEVIHQAEFSIEVHDPRNVEAVILNTDAALRYGAELDASNWAALGDAYRWSDQVEAATTAYETALSLRSRRPDRLHRAIAELMANQESPSREDVVVHIDAILGDESASPNNYLWAVEQRIAAHLDRGDPAAAMHIVTTAKSRLVGTEFLPVVSFSEALTLREAGLRDEAVDLLKSLREEWGVRDELWARAGHLLGKMELEDARPQSALTYFEDVLKSFQSGRVHEMCQLGRAESLAQLERFEEALGVFRMVRDVFRSPRTRPAIDRDEVRLRLTRTCDELSQNNRWALSVAYLETALDMVDPEDTSLRIWYLSRLATSLKELGERRQRDRDTAGKIAAREYRQYFERAAKVCFELAQLTFSEDQTSAEWVEKAATYLGQAGQTERMIKTLHP